MLQKTLTGGVLYHIFSYKAICLFLRKKKRKRKKNEENFIKQPTDEPVFSSTQNEGEKKAWKTLTKNQVLV